MGFDQGCGGGGFGRCLMVSKIWERAETTSGCHSSTDIASVEQWRSKKVEEISKTVTPSSLIIADDVLLAEILSVSTINNGSKLVSFVTPASKELWVSIPTRTPSSKGSALNAIEVRIWMGVASS